MKNQDPEYKKQIKELQEKARQQGTPQHSDYKKPEKKDLIEFAYKKSIVSQKSMYRQSMKHLNELLNNKKQRK